MIRRHCLAIGTYFSINFFVYRFRNLSNNNITAVQALDLSALRDLKALDFSYNQLTAISEGSFIHLQQLEELDLHHNHINCIDPSGLSSLQKLRYL